LNPEACKQYLEEVCGTDASLRNKLDAMLDAHHKHRTPIPQGATKHDTNPQESMKAHLGLKPGDVLDETYRIIELISEGGMGAVYRAVRITDMRMEVAIKVIKPEFASPSTIARFENEKQALAIMDHPNIAKVLDAGTTIAGMPYFAMDLIKGIPITQYCDKNKLTVRERLELFLPICDAIQHAHQKGVVHRDLKPSNILVAHYDEKAVPKVIDFGLAKALHQPLTADYIHTGFKTFVGTYQYAAPEQAKLNNLDIDTRADVYSLGVVLYEMLTGVPTLTHERITRLLIDEVLRAIREEAPPKPSTKIGSSEQLPNLAALRRCEPVTLKKQVQGEIDWIVMKALEKERGRRYSSAQDLAKDIDAYLHGDKIAAAPPSRSYQIKCFMRKHKSGVVAASIMAGLLVMGLVVTVAALFRAIRAEEDALNKLASANAWAAFIDEGLFASLDPIERHRLNLPIENNVLVRDMLRKAITAINSGSLKDYPDVELKVRYSLGKGLAAIGEFAEARDHFKAVLSHAPSAPALVLQAEVHDRIGDTYYNEGKYDEAAREYEQAINQWQIPGSASKHALHKSRVKLLALDKIKAKAPNEQVTLLQRMKELQQSIEHEQDHLALVMINLQIASMYDKAKQSKEQVSVLEKTLEYCRRNLAATHPDTLETMNELACAHHNTRNYPAAEKLFMELQELAGRIYDNDHILKALYKCNYAGCLTAKQEFRRASALFAEGLPVFNRVSPKHEYTLDFRHAEASTFYLDGQYKLARVKYQELIPLFQTVHGPASTELQELMSDLAKAALQEKDVPSVIEQLKNMATMAINTDDMNGQILIDTLRDMRDLLKEGGRLGEFQAMADSLVSFIRASNPKFEKLALAVANTKQ
jgi:eukaryotic-like serine/threonine-protein kinase